MPPALLKIMQATRYHTGGIAGQQPDALLQPGRPYVMPPAVRNESAQTTTSKSATNNFNVTVSVTGAMDKRTAEQTGAQIAQAARRVMARGTA